MDAMSDQTRILIKDIPPTDQSPVPGTGQDVAEFKIEIRKLEVPIRPRGVLAE